MINPSELPQGVWLDDNRLHVMMGVQKRTPEVVKRLLEKQEVLHSFVTGGGLVIVYVLAT